MIINGPIYSEDEEKLFRLVLGATKIKIPREMHCADLKLKDYVEETFFENDVEDTVYEFNNQFYTRSLFREKEIYESPKNLVLLSQLLFASHKSGWRTKDLNDDNQIKKEMSDLTKIAQKRYLITFENIKRLIKSGKCFEGRAAKEFSLENYLFDFSFLYSLRRGREQGSIFFNNSRRVGEYPIYQNIVLLRGDKETEFTPEDYYTIQGDGKNPLDFEIAFK